MHRVLRVLLVWLVVIAMPVQGMAASLMLRCGPGQQHMPHGPAGAGHQASDPADGVACHGIAEADSGDAASPHHAKNGCSACAACCSALALPAGWLLPLAMAPVQVAQAAPPMALPSQPPDGLDRPPRNAVA